MWPTTDDRALRRLVRCAGQEAVPGYLRGRLQTDIEARFGRAVPGRAYGRPAYALRAGVSLASALLLVPIVAGILLGTSHNQRLFAAVLDAMAQAKTAHVVSVDGPEFEEWLSTDYGERVEQVTSPSERVITVANAQATWQWRAHGGRGGTGVGDTVTAMPADRDLAAKRLGYLSGAFFLEQIRAGTLGAPVTVSDAKLDGAPAIRINLDMTEQSGATGVLWVDRKTMRVVMMELWQGGGGEQQSHQRVRIEYDVPVDPALFQFTPPSGAQIVDLRKPEPHRTGREDRDTPLFKAFGAGDMARVRSLVETGADVNAHGEGGMTPLHEAAVTARPEMVELLLQHGADPNSRRDSGATPLMEATQNLNMRVARLLLDGGADVNAATKKGTTTLHFAAAHGQLALIELLLQHGANVNARDGDGWTPLGAAAGFAHPRIARLLVAKGADVNVADKRGYTPLHGAVGAATEASDNGSAAEVADALELVRFLIDRGADVNARDGKGRTPLTRALAASGPSELVQMLRQCGAVE
jgi:ankyrin repeat protein/outer membrane lipoprotein-sorting protein